MARARSPPAHGHVVEGAVRFHVLQLLPRGERGQRPDLVDEVVAHLVRASRRGCGVRTPGGPGSPGARRCRRRASSASLTVRRMVAGSPAWNPHAMLADVTQRITSASRPIDQAPKLSPMSQLKSNRTVPPRAAEPPAAASRPLPQAGAASRLPRQHGHRPGQHEIRVRSPRGRRLRQPRRQALPPHAARHAVHRSPPGARRPVVTCRLASAAPGG